MSRFPAPSAVVEYENLLDTSFNDANQSYKTNVMPRWERKKLQQQQQQSMQQQQHQQLKHQQLKPKILSSNNNNNNEGGRLPLGSSALTNANSNNNNPINASSGDRFIPSRGNMEIAKHQMMKRHHSSLSNDSSISSRPDDDSNRSHNNDNSAPPTGTENQTQQRTITDDKKDVYASNLSSALLGVDDMNNNRILSYTEKAPAPKGDTINNLNVLYSVSASASQKKHDTKLVNRHIPTAPSRILDAPDIMDDYYLNVVSWNDQNVLAVALGQTVYLWNAATSAIDELCTFDQDINAHISSLQWVQEGGTHLAIGVSSGATQLWDINQYKQVRAMDGHTDRVSSLSWNRHILSSGSRDTSIINHDVRIAQHKVSTYQGHTQEVCGLSWSPDGEILASGANDNLLCLWNATSSGTSSTRPRYRMTDHQAAVKALAWSPHERHLLATGAGTADRTIKFWNTNTGSLLNSIDTGSQVCSLLWNPYDKYEILSSHGYSRNQLTLWKYPNMTKIKDFEGHTSRVLYMVCSPVDGTILSAAADETLRFWDIFTSSRLASTTSSSTVGAVSKGKMGGITTTTSNKTSWTNVVR